MLWICQGDGVAFSVGAPQCPQCGGTTYREQGDEAGPIRSTETGEPIDPPAAGATSVRAGRSKPSALVSLNDPAQPLS